jgi:hypothetical protein
LVGIGVHVLSPAVIEADSQPVHIGAMGGRLVIGINLPIQNRRAPAIAPMARPPTRPMRRTRDRYPGHRRRKVARNRYQATVSTPYSRRQTFLDLSTCVTTPRSVVRGRSVAKGAAHESPSCQRPESRAKVTCTLASHRCLLARRSHAGAVTWVVAFLGCVEGTWPRSRAGLPMGSYAPPILG